MSTSEEVKGLSGVIKTSMKVNKDGTTEVQDDIWEKTLPEGLTKKQVAAVKNHEANFIAAGALALGELAVDAMKKHSGLDEVKATVKMHGRDSASFQVNRSRSFRNPQNPDADPVVKFGTIATSFKNHAGRNAGELKKVMEEIGELAGKTLGK